MRILQVSAELFPLLKTGGLADVAGALPAALGAQGCAVRALLPGFPAVVAGLRAPHKVGSFTTPWGEGVDIVLGELPGLGTAGGALQAYVLMAPGLYDRPGNPYHDTQHNPYADNHRRFAALAWGAAHLAYGLDAGWSPQLVHCHDWHAGLAPACMAYWNSPQRVPTLFTIHNLAYQGCFAATCFADLGLPDADKLKIKSGLVIEITKAMRTMGITQKAAAERMGISQPKVSAMLRGDFTNLSERKLMDCLNRLGYDIEIKVRPAAEPLGHLVLAIA